MKIGESLWILPWAIFIGGDGEVYVNGKYTTHAHPGGTVDTILHRTEYGYIVNLSHSRYREQGFTKGASYAGGASPIPVYRIEGI
jgi:hypothetical protein